MAKKVNWDAFIASLGPEDKMQAAFIRFINLQYPGLVVYHIPNEGRRTDAERMRNAVVGVLKGMPDLHFPALNLFIELKTPRGRLTDSQQDMHEKLRGNGCRVEVINNLDELIDFIKGIIKEQLPHMVR